MTCWLVVQKVMLSGGLRTHKGWLPPPSWGLYRNCRGAGVLRHFVYVISISMKEAKAKWFLPFFFFFKYSLT